VGFPLRRQLLLAQALTALLTSSVGWGAEQPVRITQRGCDDVDLARLDELVAIEVDTVASELSPRQSDVFLECRAGAISIKAELRESSASRSSKVEPRSMDRAAATRLLALTITELLAQLWSEKPAPSAPIEQPEPATPELDAPPEKSAAAAGERRFAAYAGAAYHSMLEPRAGLFGGALRAEYAPLSLLTFGLDFVGAFGTVRSEHAEVDVMLASAAVYATLGGRVGPVALGIGPGARLGWVNLSPEDLEPNSDGSDVSGAWGGPMLLGLAKWAPNGYLLYSSLELGAVTLPVVGTFNGAEPEVELKGLWFLAGLGVGANL
jgi:hypothetical protein